MTRDRDALLKNIGDRLNQLRLADRDEIERLTNEKASSDQKIQVLEDEAKQAALKLSKAEEELGEVKQKCVDLQIKHDEIRAQLQKAEDDFAKIDDLITVAEENLRSSIRKPTELSSAIKVETSETTGLTPPDKTRDDNEDTVSQKLDAAEETIRKADVKFNNQHTECDTKSSRITLLEKELEEAKRTIAIQDSKIRHLEAAAAATKTANTESTAPVAATPSTGFSKYSTGHTSGSPFSSIPKPTTSASIFLSTAPASSNGLGSFSATKPWFASTTTPLFTSAPPKFGEQSWPFVTSLGNNPELSNNSPFAQASSKREGNSNLSGIAEPFKTFDTPLQPNTTTLWSTPLLNVVPGDGVNKARREHMLMTIGSFKDKFLSSFGLFKQVEFTSIEKKLYANEYTSVHAFNVDLLSKIFGGFNARQFDLTKVQEMIGSVQKDLNIMPPLKGYVEHRGGPEQIIFQ